VSADKKTALTSGEKPLSHLVKNPPTPDVTKEEYKYNNINNNKSKNVNADKKITD